MEEEVKIRKVHFYNNKNKKLVGILEESNKENIVILCHGLGGDKNSGTIQLLRNHLSENQFSVLTFDFTGNGESEGEFSEGNYTQEIDDLGKAIDFVKALGYNKITLMGHSMGGAVSILRTSKDSRINCLISIASPGESSRFRKKFVSTEEKKKQLDNEGYVLIKNNKKITKEFIEDIERHNVINSLKEIKIPFLIMQGDKDETVPVQTAKDIYENANEPKEIKIISNANHFFGDNTETKEYKELKQKILQFLTKNLK